MKPDTRQTMMGVFGLTLVEVVALTQGFNGTVTGTYFLAVIAIVAPQALQDMNVTFPGGD